MFSGAPMIIVPPVLDNMELLDREEVMRSEAKENFKLLQDNMDLIISSYKYRLVELCRGL